MWRHLEADFDLILVDMRGHGNNPAVEPESINGPRITTDLKETLEVIHHTWGKGPIYGLFHSYSGLTALRLESVEPGWFAGLVLMEPPATRSPDHPEFQAFDDGRIMLAERTLKRQAEFETVEELTDKYAGRPQFARFADGAAECLARSLLTPDGGRWRLLCRPEIEAQFYATNEDDGLWQRLGAIACPVMMLAGSDDLRERVPPAVAALDLARAGGFDFVEVAGTTHMMVLERPRFIAELAAAYVRSIASSEEI